MTFLISKIIGGEAVYRRGNPPRPKYSSTYEYNHDDEVSEAHRKRDNWTVLRKLVSNFRAMKQEAINGFIYQSLPQQYDVLRQRKDCSMELIRQGSFHPKQFKKIMKRTKQRIEQIYMPYMEGHNEKLGKLLN